MSGVRSSCDSVARNSSFRRLASWTLDVQPGVLECDRRPGRDADREAFVLVGEHAGAGVAEEQRTDHLPHPPPTGTAR